MESLVEYIKRKTNKDIHNGDYGFILGTSNPFGAIYGLHNASAKKGFDIWEKGGRSKTILTENPEEIKKEIIDFLNEKH